MAWGAAFMGKLTLVFELQLCQVFVSQFTSPFRRTSTLHPWIDSLTGSKPNFEVFECCQVEVFATGRSFLYRSATD